MSKTEQLFEQTFYDNNTHRWKAKEVVDLVWKLPEERRQTFLRSARNYADSMRPKSQGFRILFDANFARYLATENQWSVGISFEEIMEEYLAEIKRNEVDDAANV